MLHSGVIAHDRVPVVGVGPGFKRSPNAHAAILPSVESHKRFMIAVMNNSNLKNHITKATNRGYGGLEYATAINAEELNVSKGFFTDL